MKVKYDKKVFDIEITKEELLNTPPEKLARIMITKIENEMYEECMKTMIEKLWENNNDGCFSCKRALWDMDGCTCKLTGFHVGNVSIGCENRKER